MVDVGNVQDQIAASIAAQAKVRDAARAASAEATAAKAATSPPATGAETAQVAP